MIKVLLLATFLSVSLDGQLTEKTEPVYTFKTQTGCELAAAVHRHAPNGFLYTFECVPVFLTKKFSPGV